ncbi:MAG: tetratricopeptide repeat protein [Gammaproteobacteria bacterium]|nr:tetratricopeptide repeat protein [Gammaproteobacteria bacterium]MDH5800663.1 tetratricopeptide repeat protein [Gammaproteobacteria bacterium]
MSGVTIDFREKQLREQLKKYQAYHEQDPGNVNIVAQLSDLHYQLGQFDAAKEVLQSVNLQAEPGLMFRLSNIAIARGDAEEAIEVLEQLNAMGVDNSAVKYNLAFAKTLTRQFEDAKELLLNIDAGDDMAPQSPKLLSRCYHHLGGLEEGIALMQEYTQQHKQDAEALGILALLNVDASHDDQARECAEQSIRIDDANLEARVALGSLALDEYDTDLAGKHFSKALNRSPKSGRAWSGLGMVDMMNMDIPKAISDLEKAVKFMPQHLGSWQALAWCQLMMDDIEGAKASFNSAMEVDHNFSENHGGLAVIAVLEGRRDEAKALARKAVLLDPNSFSGRFAQSMLQNDTDPEKAKESIMNILQTDVGGGKSIIDYTNKYVTKNVQKLRQIQGLEKKDRH